MLCRLPPLTDRELEALRATADGRTSKSAARVMRCSPETIKDHTKMARLKLGAKTTTQAVATAIREGMM